MRAMGDWARSVGVVVVWGCGGVRVHARIEKKK
jgi:hypothetical protein